VISNTAEMTTSNPSHETGAAVLFHNDSSFRPVIANVCVLYPDGQPMSDAVVTATSLEYYFRYSGRTNSSGWTTFRAMPGNWSFISYGPGPALCPKGIGYFSCALGKILANSEEEILLKPDTEVQIELTSAIEDLTDLDKTRVSVTENSIGFIGCDFAPTVGEMDQNHLTLFTQSDITARLCFASPSPLTQPRATIFISEPVRLQGQILINLTSTNTGIIKFEFKDTEGNSASEVFLQISSSEKSWNPLDGWAIVAPFSKFTLIASLGNFSVIPAIDILEGGSLYRMSFNRRHLEPKSDDEVTLSFGGPLNSKILITPKAALGFKPVTQVMLYAIDASKNVVMSVRKDGVLLTPSLTIIADGGKHRNADSWGTGSFVSKTLEEYDESENPRYNMTYDFGPFGNNTFEGSVYDSESLRMTIIETERLIAQSPAIDPAMRQTQVDSYEFLFESMEELMGVPTDYKIGVISNIMHAGFEDEILHGFKLELALEMEFPLTWPLGDDWIAHEMGHGRLQTPPATSDYMFGESFAGLIGCKALARFFGDERFFGCLMGSHDLFLRHLHGDPVDNDDEIMMFIMHYIDRNYGWDAHRSFILEWKNAFEPIRNVLSSRGFLRIEQMATVYSYIVGENIAWLFRLGGFNVADTSVDSGLDLIQQYQRETGNVEFKIGETTAVTFTASVPIILRRVPSDLSKINLTLAFDPTVARILHVFRRDLTDNEKWNLTTISDAPGCLTIVLEGSENLTRIGSVAQVNIQLIPTDSSQLQISVLDAKTNSKQNVVTEDGRIVTSQLSVVRPKELPFKVIWNETAYYVIMSSNSTIKDFHINQANRTLLFNVTAPIGTSGFCNVIIPKDLLNASAEEWIVLVDNEPVDPIVTWNATNTFLYFTYFHSTHQIIIIPEFPSFLILPPFMIVTLLAVMIHKEKHSL
jgi:hypothetical protein